MSLVQDIINPEIEIESKKTGLKILFKGPTFDMQQWIDKPLFLFFKKYNTEDIKETPEEIQEEYEHAEREALNRAIRACIKNVEGLAVKKNGQVEEFKLTFKNDVVSKEDYEIVMRAISTDEDLIKDIFEKYQKTKDVSEYIEIKKKN